MKRRAGLWLLAALAVAGCGARPSSSECGVLLDRYVELLLVGDRPAASASEVLRVQQEARKKAARDPAFAECPSRVSRRALECAMKAPNADGLEQCLL